jgi:hypothetical protein
VAELELFLLQLRIAYVDVHLAVGAVAVLVGRRVSDQILCTKFLLDFGEGVLQVGFTLREKCATASTGRYCINRIAINPFIFAVADTDGVNDCLSFERAIYRFAPGQTAGTVETISEQDYRAAPLIWNHPSTRLRVNSPRTLVRLII